MVCLALGLFPKCFAQTGEIAKDPRLQKPVTIRLKIAQLPDALKQISKLTGVKLECMSLISDLKVTVLVSDMPSGLVLDKIANVLGCRWTADGDLFRLGMDSDERSRRDKYVEAENDAAQKEIEKELNQVALASTMDPLAAGQELQEQMAALKGDPSGKVKYDPDRVSLLKKVGATDIAFGQFLTNLNAAKVSAFWKGSVVVGPSPLGRPDPAPVDATATSDQVPPQRTRPRRVPAPVPVFVQYDPLLYQVHISQRGATRVFAKRAAHLVTEFAPTGQLATLPFGKEVLSWDQGVPTDGDLAKQTMDPATIESKNANYKFSTADLLEQVFDTSGVQIVADAFRTPVTMQNAGHVGGSVGAWFAAFKLQSHVFTRFEDGVVLVRHGGFWRLRKFETPEELLAPLEKKASGTGPSLDDYAAFAAKLSPEQAEPFLVHGESVTKFDPKPIETCLPALQFYASLDSRAINLATQDGISYAQLQSTQRQLFDQAALEGVFLGASNVAFNESLIKLSTSGDGRGLGFLMRKGIVDPKGGTGDGQSMLFGANLNQASTYSIPLR